VEGGGRGEGIPAYIHGFNFRVLRVFRVSRVLGVLRILGLRASVKFLEFGVS
jgi:hypothetical protein